MVEKVHVDVYICKVLLMNVRTLLVVWILIQSVKFSIFIEGSGGVRRERGWMAGLNEKGAGAGDKRGHR